MKDLVTPKKRSVMMSKVRSKNTKPEMLVRRSLHALGYRYRINFKDLPGKPDIVLPKYKTVVFVHGCFWHQHPDCKKATLPKTNHEYWKKKLTDNTERDIKINQELQFAGWRIITIWECEIEKDPHRIISQVDKQLKSVSDH